MCLKFCAQFMLTVRFGGSNLSRFESMKKSLEKCEAESKEKSKVARQKTGRLSVKTIKLFYENDLGIERSRNHSHFGAELRRKCGRKPYDHLAKNCKNMAENVTENHMIFLGEKLEKRGDGTQVYLWQKTAKSWPSSGENVMVNHKISLGKKLQNHGHGPQLFLRRKSNDLERRSGLF